MDLIIGGAYQGKRDYAVRAFSLASGDIYTCNLESVPDFTSRCIEGLEEFALLCVREGADPVEALRAHRGEWERSVIIMTDISCGVVPLGEENRAWREAAGRLSAFLATEAESVTRVFCGLAQRLK